MSVRFLTTEDVRNGSEPLIREAIEYLERQGITHNQIHRLVIDAEVGEPITITPTLYVQTEPSTSIETRGSAL